MMNIIKEAMMHLPNDRESMWNILQVFVRDPIGRSDFPANIPQCFAKPAEWLELDMTIVNKLVVQAESLDMRDAANAVVVNKMFDSLIDWLIFSLRLTYVQIGEGVKSDMGIMPQCGQAILEAYMRTHVCFSTMLTLHRPASSRFRHNAADFFFLPHLLEILLRSVRFAVKENISRKVFLYPLNSLNQILSMMRNINEMLLVIDYIYTRMLPPLEYEYPQENRPALVTDLINSLKHAEGVDFPKLSFLSGNVVLDLLAHPSSEQELSQLAESARLKHEDRKRIGRPTTMEEGFHMETDYHEKVNIVLRNSNT